jgi:galactokinase
VELKCVRDMGGRAKRASKVFRSENALLKVVPRYLTESFVTREFACSCRESDNLNKEAKVLGKVLVSRLTGEVNPIVRFQRLIRT